MAWVVYILRCGDGTLYTGCTNDLPRRLEAHRTGRGAKYTRGRPPVTLAYQEAAPDRSAALRREAAIKRLTRQQKLELMKERKCADAGDAAEGPADAGGICLGGGGQV